MNALLLVFFLNVESSHLQNVERVAQVEADTIQFVLLHGHAWRIKTFAIDHDVHVWSMGPMTREAFEQLARANTQEHYGDVLARAVAVEAADEGVDALAAALGRAGLAAHLERSKDGAFAFWVPQPGVYRTRSSPR